MRILIVGGVAGGMSAATRLRRLDESAEIVVFERSGHVSFANCGLPYYVGGVIDRRSALLLQTPKSLADRFAIDVRVRHEVLAIDPAAKTVTVADLERDEVATEPYDALILSPGASPFVPEIPGRELAKTLRNVEDVDAMVAALPERGDADESVTGRAVIMGAGFIGLELAEQLRHRGLDVTVVELANQVLAPLDPELAALIAEELAANGVDLRLATSVAAIEPESVTLSTGERLQADLVVAAIGVRPETGLARAAGIALGPRGGILVDDQLRTSNASIWAVGDAVEKPDAVDGGQALVPLANPANRQGRLVADAILGRKIHSSPAQGTAIVRVFSLVAATTGWNEKRLRAAGRPYRAIHTHPANHAGYYPGAEGMSLKLLVDPATDEILGAQGVGGDGVDKRIDVLATAMRGGLRASDLIDLELAYAPPFGSAKDPINMLGYIADNLATGATETIQWHELDDALAAGIQLIDVRTAAEFRHGSIPGAVNIPVDELRSRLDEVESESIVHCQVGLRGHTAARILSQHGFKTRNLDGGYRTWLPAQSQIGLQVN